MGEESKKSAKKRKTQGKNTNMYDFLINLTDKTYDLINSGNIIGIAVVILLFILYKLSSDSINEHVRAMIALLASEKFYMIPLFMLLLFSVSINIYQRKIYKLEIKRLTDLRSTIIHGRETGELTTLQEHTSIDFNIEET
ncbi:MAG: hypothetical protein L7F77_04525 [Candidatus Magnetominusculus sp. LBB02]|nr:hypothetical protein [Candidatus Magnetominusculus sp. LBB02]